MMKKTIVLEITVEVKKKSRHCKDEKETLEIYLEGFLMKFLNGMHGEILVNAVKISEKWEK